MQKRAFAIRWDVLFSGGLVFGFGELGFCEFYVAFGFLNSTGFVYIFCYCSCVFSDHVYLEQT